MSRDDYLKLINRELDGEITPEEEATLMDRVSRDPGLAREYEALHALRRGFRAMGRPAPAPELATRIADEVLTASPRRSLLQWSYPLARRAAVLLVVLTLGLTAGWFLGQSGNGADVVADPGRERLEIDRELSHWKQTLSLDARQVAEWRRLREESSQRQAALPAGADEEQRRLGDELLAARLRLLSPRQRQIFMEIRGLTRERVDRLLSESRGR